MDLLNERKKGWVKSIVTLSLYFTRYRFDRYGTGTVQMDLRTYCRYRSLPLGLTICYLLFFLNNIVFLY